jgi:putative transposase
MSNHIHMILEPFKEALATGVYRFAGRYAQHYNSRHKRRGHVYQGRFRSIIVQNGLYLPRLARYIHLNPVESGLVNKPEGINGQVTMHILAMPFLLGFR